MIMIRFQNVKILNKIFNREFNFKIIWPIILPAISLCIFGLVLLRSTSFDSIGSSTNYITFYNQLQWMGIGLAVFIFMQFIRLKILNEYAYHLYIFLIISLIITYFMPERGGSSRWIEIGPFSFQPSEFGKIILVCALAKFLSDRKDNKDQFITIILSLIIGLIPALLVFGQPDLGTALIYLAVIFPMLYWIGLRPFYLFLFIAPVVSMISSYSIETFSFWMLILILVLFYSQPTIFQATIVFIINTCSGLLAIAVYDNLYPHQQDRLLTLLDPMRDRFGSGYQVFQSIISIGSGGISGKGFNQGTQSHLQYLPEKSTDFIIAVAGEEFGLIGISFILLMFGIFTYWVTEYLNKFNNDFSSLSLVGVFTILYVHLIVNMGMTVGLFPVTGLPAPFLSYGGTFFITCALILSIINNNITNNI